MCSGLVTEAVDGDALQITCRAGESLESACWEVASAGGGDFSRFRHVRGSSN